MGHKSLHNLFTEEQSGKKVKEGAAIVIKNYRDLAVNCGWERAADTITKAIAEIETTMRETQNDIRCW